MSKNEIDVVDVPQANRYEARSGDAPAGRLEYRRHKELIELDHTAVEPAFEGQGVGGAIARGALDAARADGLAVLPHCPFVSGWIQRHREYADLVPEAQREKFGLA